MDQKRLPAGARDKLPFWFPAAWSTRAVALSMQMTMAGFMGVYFTDVLGLNPAIIGVLLMISRFSDAITDLSSTAPTPSSAKPVPMSLPSWCCGPPSTPCTRPRR